MFEKLKEISKFILLPSALLYFFGFICVAAYFARFGIVSFEIINSRFIIAGVYPLVAIAFALLFAWYLFVEAPRKRFPWRVRYLFYCKYLFYLFVAANALTELFNLGRYSDPYASTVFDFKSMGGQYDIVGRLIERAPKIIGSEFDFVIKCSIYIFLYIAPLGLLLWTLLAQLRKRAQSQNRQEKQRIPGNTEAPSATPKPTTDATFFERVFVFLADLFFMAFYMSLVLYSLFKLRVSLVDFSSFTTPEDLTSGLMFAWLCSSIAAVITFLGILRIPPEQLPAAIVRGFKHPVPLQFILQFLVTPLLVSLFVFGMTIFPRIPFSTGGGQPHEVTLKFHDSAVTFDGQRLFLIGESSQFLFVVESDSHRMKALEINKAIVDVVETRKKED